jgi:nitronate monooxygenase
VTAPAALSDRFDLARRPIVVAPMGGGPSTPALVTAAAGAGALAFLAGGYKTAAAMRSEIDTVAAAIGPTAPFGVNVFVPRPSTTPPEAVAAYLTSLAPDAARLGVALGEPTWDDDDWAAKVADLVARPVPVVSFTFGCPPPELVAALSERGTVVLATVTTPAEADLAVAAGVDGLCVQGFEAGAHRGAFTDGDEPGADWGLLALLGEIRRRTAIPIVAAGGISGPEGVTAVRAAGAVAAMVGTLFLRSPEAGTSAPYRAALADPRSTTTTITRAFSGRRARGLVNRFLLDHPDAPPAYPEINNATRPLRAAAAAAGDADRLSLWAGQGFRAAADRPAAEIVEWLASGA